MKKTCWCGAIAALLILIFTWVWVPSWANIAVTILAVIMLIMCLSGGCICKKGAEKKGAPPATPPETPPTA